MLQQWDLFSSLVVIIPYYFSTQAPWSWFKSSGRGIPSIEGLPSILGMPQPLQGACVSHTVIVMAFYSHTRGTHGVAQRI